jgi:hypothetical protein
MHHSPGYSILLKTGKSLLLKRFLFFKISPVHNAVLGLQNGNCRFIVAGSHKEEARKRLIAGV